MIEKVCSTCGKQYEYAEGNFSTNGLTAAGTLVYRSSCKQCEKERVKQIRRSRPELLAKQREARKNKRYLAMAKLQLTKPIECSVCKKIFVVTILPEFPGSVSLTCSSCLNPAQQENKQGE